MPQEHALETALARDLEGCFERMVREYQDRLYSFAHRLAGNPQDAEEIAQDAFVRAYRGLAPKAREQLPGEAVAAFSEAIQVIRALWTPGRRVRIEGTHYRLAGAKPGPFPVHPIGIWVGHTRRHATLAVNIATGVLLAGGLGWWSADLLGADHRLVHRPSPDAPETSTLACRNEKTVRRRRWSGVSGRLREAPRENLRSIVDIQLAPKNANGKIDRLLLAKG